MCHQEHAAVTTATNNQQRWNHLQIVQAPSNRHGGRNDAEQRASLVGRLRSDGQNATTANPSRIMSADRRRAGRFRIGSEVEAKDGNTPAGALRRRLPIRVEIRLGSVAEGDGETDVGGAQELRRQTPGPDAGEGGVCFGVQ